MVLSLEDDSSQYWLEAALRAKIKAWGWLTVKQTRGEIREAPSSKPEEQKRLNNIGGKEGSLPKCLACTMLVAFRKYIFEDLR